MILEVKDGPLSLCRDRGRPNWGINSFRRALATSAAFSILVGKASIHPVQVSTRTSKYIYPLQGGILVVNLSVLSWIGPSSLNRFYQQGQGWLLPKDLVSTKSTSLANIFYGNNYSPAYE